MKEQIKSLIESSSKEDFLLGLHLLDSNDIKIEELFFNCAVHMHPTYKQVTVDLHNVREISRKYDYILFNNFYAFIDSYFIRIRYVNEGVKVEDTTAEVLKITDLRSHG